MKQMGGMVASGRKIYVGNVLWRKLCCIRDIGLGFGMKIVTVTSENGHISVMEVW